MFCIYGELLNNLFVLKLQNYEAFVIINFLKYQKKRDNSFQFLQNQRCQKPSLYQRMQQAGSSQKKSSWAGSARLGDKVKMQAWLGSNKFWIYKLSPAQAEIKKIKI